MFMLILTIIFAILMAGVLYCEYDNPKFLWVFSILWAVAYMIAVLVFTNMESPSSIPQTNIEPDIYLVYAEKITEKDGVITFATLNLNDNQFYTWVNQYGHDYPDVPYILTMDSKGTQDLKDDEILAIWENK